MNRTPHRLFLFVLLAFMFLATEASADLKHPSPDIKPDRLAALEKELSIPICGLGYLDTRMDQLKKFKGIDNHAYLTVIAHNDYSANEGKQYLPSLAVQLLGVLNDDKASDALKGVIDDTTLPYELRLLASTTIASRFSHKHGLALLKQAALDGSVQQRADTIEPLLAIGDREALELIVPRAFDSSGYVLERLVWSLNDHQGQREKLRAMLASTPVPLEHQGRLFVSRLLLGDLQSRDDARAYLASWSDVLTSEQQLYDQAQICAVLVRRGFTSGFDCAARAIERFTETNGRIWYLYTLSVAVNHSPYTQPEGSTTPATEADALRRWITANRDRLRYVPDTQKFEFR